MTENTDYFQTLHLLQQNEPNQVSIKYRQQTVVSLKMGPQITNNTTNAQTPAQY